jgi:hypothetical protein
MIASLDNKDPLVPPDAIPPPPGRIIDLLLADLGLGLLLDDLLLVLPPYHCTPKRVIVGVVELLLVFEASHLFAAQDVEVLAAFVTPFRLQLLF